MKIKYTFIYRSSIQPSHQHNRCHCWKTPASRIGSLTVCPRRASSTGCSRWWLDQWCAPKPLLPVVPTRSVKPPALPPQNVWKRKPRQRQPQQSRRLGYQRKLTWSQLQFHVQVECGRNFGSMISWVLPAMSFRAWSRTKCSILCLLLSLTMPNVKLWGLVWFSLSRASTCYPSAQTRENCTASGHHSGLHWSVLPSGKWRLFLRHCLAFGSGKFC